MKFLGLAAFLSSLALSGAAGRAQPVPADQKTAEAVVSARETLKSLDSALAPLSRGDYVKKDRRAVLPILERFQKQLDVFRPTEEQAATPRAASWTKLQKNVAATLRQEKEFWAALPDPDSDDPQPLPAKTVDELKRRSAEISAGFSGLFPERGLSERTAVAEKGAGEGPDRVPTQTAQAVARGASRGGAAAAHPEQFFDGTVVRGGQAAPSAPGAPAVAVTPRPRARLPMRPAALDSKENPDLLPSSLKVNPVPGPAAVAEGPSWVRSRAALSAVGGATPEALRDAVRSTPVLTGAANAVTPVKAAALAPAAVAPAAAPPDAASAETLACLQAVAGHPSVTGLCKSHPTVAPLLAGLLEALQEQFGTVQGLVVNLAYLLLGLVMSALTGFGLIAKVVVGLVSLAMLAGTIYPLLQQGYAAVKQLRGTQAGDVRHSESLLSLGKLGGTVLIMALMAAIGYGVAKTQTGQAVMGSATEAVSSKLADLGLKDGMAALDAKIPPGIRAFLGAPKPAEAASLSDFGGSATSLPRSVKSTMLFSEETLRRNAAISDREIRIGAAMKQLGADRAFAEKVADAHEKVPCAVGKCTQDDLRRKLEIMGRGPQAANAIRSGLAGYPPDSAPALGAAPAPFLDEQGRHSSRGVAPAAAPAAKFEVPPGKWDYFFGRVKAKAAEGLSAAEIQKQSHNASRSAQIARVLADNGINDDPAGRALMTKLFNEAASAKAIREVKTEHGVSVVKPAELPGATLEVSFFYPKDAAGRVDLDAAATVTSIIPKEH